MKRDNSATCGSCDVDIEAAIESFEHAYLRDGHADPIAFCPPIGHIDHLPILCELIRIDLEFSFDTDQPKSLVDYQRRFPHLFADPDCLRQIAFEEYRLRCDHGQTATPQEYAERYGVDIRTWSSAEEYPHHTAIRRERRTQLAVDSLSPPDPKPERSSPAELPTRFPDAGESFAGFRIIRELGRGAFARVYLAHQAELADRPIALKISTDLGGESQTLARLQHTNIVPIHSTHRLGAFHAVCMPYFGGTTLADLLRSCRDRPSYPDSSSRFETTLNQWQAISTIHEDRPRESTTDPQHPPRTPIARLRQMTHREAVLWIIAELADGLAHAHDRGILHRDLKPANILLSDDGRPMLLDFNLATDPNDPVQAIIGGTPYYMSPEQLNALRHHPIRLDERSDLYSLGLILYELLTGQLPTPMPRGGFHERIRQLELDRAAPLPTTALHHPAITPAVRTILSKCLAIDPAQRYHSAHDLRDDLRAHLDDRPLPHTREPWTLERFHKWRRRNRWVHSLPVWGGVCTILLALAVGSYHYAMEQARQRNARVLADSVSEELALTRPRLIAPTPDAELLQRDIARTESALRRMGLPDQSSTLDEQLIPYLDPLARDRLREQLADAMLMLAFRSANGDQHDGALRWNQQAAMVAPDPGRRWAAQHQRIELLDAAQQKDEASRLRALLSPPPAGTATILYQCGQAFQRGDFTQARAILALADAETRRRADYWHALGRCHAECEEWADARAAYSTALTHQADENAHLLALRGQASFALGDFPAARADFTAAIRIDPDEPRNYVDRALVHLNEHHYPESLLDLAEAEKRWPQHTRIRFIRVEVLRAQAQPAAAEEELTAALRLTPSDEASWLARGLARLDKEPNEAWNDFNAALRLNPRSRAARQNQSHVLAEYLQREAEAIEVLTTIIEEAPHDLAARAGRGVLLARAKRYSAARADAEFVLQHRPSPMIRYQVAGIFALSSIDNSRDESRALALLAHVFQEGVDPKFAQNDRDLLPLMKQERFQKVVAAASLLRTTQANRDAP